MTHTKTPWELYEIKTKDSDIAFSIGGEIHGGGVIAGIYSHPKFDCRGGKTKHYYDKDRKAQDQANAAFIVTACNCHDELLEACKLVKDFFDQWHMLTPEQETILEHLNQAIQKAEGKNG